ncbi:pilus assembly PilX family protein [Colwellia sp. 12G3]|uniref:pilus assembly PilX family protein n=1 Tax=Colwellia sp. 12G3 TaxID=2058299 RepID=UPI000C327309|nr:hypothetical protein [Colwellia sp. 12G3]PKI14282.1 hypothetical protein CXF71_17125 [Colwellia sp. 12G3]
MVIKSHQYKEQPRKVVIFSGGKPVGNQRGAIVISLSIIFLLLTTFVTLYSTKAILLEQKIVNNQTRSALAFEAAEFGLSTAVQYISDGIDRDDDTNIDPIFAPAAAVAPAVLGVGTTNTSLVGTVVGKQQSVTVTITDITTAPDTFFAFRIVSQGFSDDSSATRTITQVIRVVDALPNVPDNPLTARGTVDIAGSATVINPEGTSSIWSGGDVELGANNSVSTEVADPSDANYPLCMDTPMKCNTVSTSNKVTVGLDIIEHDSNLANLTAEKMFENFFGMTPAAYKASTVTMDLAGGSDFGAAHLATNEVIWYDGDADINGGTVGCTVAVTGGNICDVANEDPSIVIIDGNADMKGGPHFYGIVFVMGNVTLSGNSTVHGAMIVAGESNTTGSLNIWYNSRLLSNTRDNGGFSAASGAWKDF